MTDTCYHSSLISLDDALQRIAKNLTPIKLAEQQTLKQSLGRVLSHDCHAHFDLPPFDNSAMDGYAFNSHDITSQAFQLTQVGTSWAGHPFEGKLLAGQCVRIFTGGVIPDGADSVIMQEQVQIIDDVTIQLPSDTQAQQHIRPKGEDAQQGDCLLSAPKQLTATDLGLLASAGFYNLTVNRKLRIAFFSTGDELRPVGSKLAAGEIYDSNRYTLNALLQHPCHSVTDLGVLIDDKALIKQTLLDSAENYDVIISTGGASVGDADYIQEILTEIGEVNFWKLAIKPGKPLAFGHIKQCCFFGLPGNPISVIATFQQLVIPALQQLSGLPAKKPLRLKALCKSTLTKKAGRLEFQRGILSQTDTGDFEVVSAGKQGSNILTASSRANCYIILAAEQTQVNNNQMVTVEPFELFL